MQQKIAWDKVLKDVSYNHKSDSIEFTLKDIDSLLYYIERLKAKLDSSNMAIKQLQKENNLLTNQLLIKALKSKSEPISNFIAYG